MKRINAIVSCVDKCRAAADIGCDHGLISKGIAEGKRAEHIYAVDISADSLEKTRAMIKKCGFEGVITALLGDGLVPVEQFAPQEIVIAGMGGHLIARILENSINTAKSAHLVLCPHSNGDFLREWLLKNGFCVSLERAVFEYGKFYQIICACAGEAREYDEESLNLGVCFEQDEEYFKLIEYKKKRCDSVLEELKKGGDSEKAKKLSALSKRAEEILKCR